MTTGLVVMVDRRGTSRSQKTGNRTLRNGTTLALTSLFSVQGRIQNGANFPS